MKVYREQARRLPVSRERYRATARHAGLSPRFRRALGVFDAALAVILVVFLAQATPAIGRVVEAGVSDVGKRFAELFPANAGTGTIDLPGPGGTVSAQPVADGLPDYTREPQLALAAHVPSFALADDRSVAVALNGTVLATVAPDAKGQLRVPLTLREGANTVELVLATTAGTVIARSTYNVVLDRQPPVLTLAKPSNGDEVVGPTVVVQGKTEPGATVTINERTAVVAQDGSFSQAVSVTAGPLPLTLVARDRAGNETTTKATITVKAPTTAPDLTVEVALDQTTVRAGATVAAQITVRSSGGPRANELVTLSVGAITIGSARTDATGVAHLTFAAPSTAGEVAVVVLASSGSGRATLTVTK